MMRFWSSRRVAARAAHWFAAILSGRFDQPADRDWQAWMDAGSDNRKTFEQISTAWEVAGLMQDEPAMQALLRDVDSRICAHHSTQRAQPRSWLPQPVMIGTTVAVLTFAAIGYWLWRPQIQEASHVTAVGEQRVVELEDQSTVALNTGTSIRVAYSRRRRDVTLLAGEAVFTVVQDAQRPFHVHALQGTSTAVGTQYAVQIVAPSTVEVSVLEGVVAVDAIGSRAADATRLQAGQAVSYAANGVMSAVRAADLDRIRGWQAQRLVFNDLSLADALTQFNRYRSTPVVLGSAGLAGRRISGVYRIGEEDAFLNALQQLYQVQVIRSEAQILLQPDARGPAP